MDAAELKKRYPLFYFHDYEIMESSQDIQVRFDFEIEGLSHFNPEFYLAKPKNSITYSSLSTVRKAAFSLGMIELISYWKLTCSPHVIVECGRLDEQQTAWWKKLYFNGLGEFFYRNGIQADPELFMNLESRGEDPDGLRDERTFCGNLIPVGGGKDSFVTLDVLSPAFDENLAFIINPIASARHSAIAAGYTGDRLLIAERTLDSRMLEFNKQGFLNGHTPFSALAAFAGMFAAIIYGKRYICLSNEASANESTVKGSTVNHQYSKTYGFEKDFQWYAANYIQAPVLYFSFLRPLSELQIAGVFSRLKQYHSVFRSCNVGQKTETWCGHCAKCLFVCVMLSAYLDNEDLKEIFHADMLNDPEMMDLFEQLTGMQDNKPFECVGTRDEVNTAVCMAIARIVTEHKDLPLLYDAYRKTPYFQVYRDRRVSWDSWNDENSLPEAFAKLLKKRLEEMKQ